MDFHSRIYVIHVVFVFFKNTNNEPTVQFQLFLLCLHDVCDFVYQTPTRIRQEA